MDVLIIEVATFLPTSVKIGRKLRARHQFFKVQDGGSRHVEFRLPGRYRYLRCVVHQSRYIPAKYGVHRWKSERTASVLQNSRWRQPPCWIPVDRRFAIKWICWLLKSLHFYLIWWKLVENWENGSSFSKFKMAAVAMLNSRWQALFVKMDVLIIEVVTFLPNLVKIGRKLRERHQFFKVPTLVGVGKTWQNGISFPKSNMVA